ncbi:hypothetical protein LINPERPRIM_LOCUS39311 [Linum perenne]
MTRDIAQLSIKFNFCQV